MSYHAGGTTNNRTWGRGEYPTSSACFRPKPDEAELKKYGAGKMTEAKCFQYFGENKAASAKHTSAQL
jgi:hypothetical protein